MQTKHTEKVIQLKFEDSRQEEKRRPRLNEFNIFLKPRGLAISHVSPKTVSPPQEKKLDFLLAFVTQET